MVSVECFVKLPLHLNEVGEEDPAYRKENEFVKRNTFTVFKIFDKTIPAGPPVITLAVYETFEGQRYAGGLAANWKQNVCNLYARVLFDLISTYHRERMVKEWLEECGELPSFKITEILEEQEVKPAFQSIPKPKKKRYVWYY
jgi:hypothetical protein